MSLNYMGVGKLGTGESSKKEDDSKDLLKAYIEKRIKTTMVGAIDSIEKYLGKIFAINQDRELSEEEKELKDIFLDLRKEILDKGNNQIRQVPEDLSKFNVTRTVYYLKLPVKG